MYGGSPRGPQIRDLYAGMCVVHSTRSIGISCASVEFFFHSFRLFFFKGVR